MCIIFTLLIKTVFHLKVNNLTSYKLKTFINKLDNAIRSVNESLNLH